MTANEIAEIVTNATPYVTAALGTYGGAVLSKTRDKGTSKAVDVGARLLERVFGQKEGEPVPEAVADVVTHPGDDEFLTALKVTIRKILEHDAAMLADVRSILAEAPQSRVTQTAQNIQNVKAGRDAFTATGDMTVYQRSE